MQHHNDATSRLDIRGIYKKFRGSQAVDKEPQGHNLNLLLDILELIKKSKKMSLAVLIVAV